MTISRITMTGEDNIEDNDDEAPRQEKVLIRQKCLLSAAVHHVFKDNDDIDKGKVDPMKPLYQMINRFDQ